MRRTLSIILVVCGLGLAHRVCAQTASQAMVMRQGFAAPEGLVHSVTLDGVWLQQGESTTASELVTWDRIALFTGRLEQEARPFRELAGDLWRARVRLERGDVLGAEPLFEKHAQKFLGREGSTAALVWSGLLRCRLTRQAHAAAVPAWIGLLASRQPEASFASRVRVGDDESPAPIIDAGSGLVPQLPPIFVSGPALQIIVQSAQSATAEQTPSRATTLLRLYGAAAAFELGEVVASESLGARPTDDEGLMFVWDVVVSRAGTGQQQRDAQAALAKRLTSAQLPRWQEAWVRVALGRSLLASNDIQIQRQGMITLLHVPARLGDAQPYLAGIALAEVAVALQRQNDSEGASAVRNRLELAYPQHPALQWESVRRVRATQPASEVER